MTRKTAGRSRRAPGDGKRDQRLAIRFSRAELAKIDAVAEREGMLTAAWAGQAVLGMADPGRRPAGRASREELELLKDATEKVRRAGVLLNQAVATMHSTGQIRPVLEHIAVRVWKKVEELDDATLAVVPRRSRRRW
jgi:hypothetical protein